MKWIKLIIGILLIPVAWSSVRYGGGFVYEAIQLGKWPWAEFGLLWAGFASWILCYLTLPRPRWLYVLEHELTHAIAVWLSFGKVEKIEVTGKGGMVVTDKKTAWIALAPYVLPLFPLFMGVFWLLGCWIWPVFKGYFGGFLFLWGMMWGFHFSFTWSTLRTEQTDFEDEGYLFSAIIVFLSNWWILIGVLIFLLDTDKEWLSHFWGMLSGDYERIGKGIIFLVKSFFLLFK